MSCFFMLFHIIIFFRILIVRCFSSHLTILTKVPYFHLESCQSGAMALSSVQNWSWASGRPVIPPRQRSKSSLEVHGYLYKERKEAKEARLKSSKAQNLDKLQTKIHQRLNDPDISYNREIARDRGTMRHSSLLQQSSLGMVQMTCLKIWEWTLHSEKTRSRRAVGQAYLHDPSCLFRMDDMPQPSPPRVSQCAS